MLKKIGAAFLSVLCLIVLLNPGAGVIDFIPDNIPFLGNLDEGAAGALLIWCLQYLFRKNHAPSPPPSVPAKKKDDPIDI